MGLDAEEQLPEQELLSADRHLRAVCQRREGFSWVHVESIATGELLFQKVRVHDPDVELVRFLTPSRLLVRYRGKDSFSLLSLDPVSNENVQTPFVLEDPQPDRISRVIMWVLVGLLVLLFTAGVLERLHRGKVLEALGFLLFATLWILIAWIWQNHIRTQQYDLVKGTLVEIQRIKGYTKRREFLFTDFDSVTQREFYHKGRNFKSTLLRGSKGRVNVIGAPDPKWIGDRLGLPVRNK